MYLREAGHQSPDLELRVMAIQQVVQCPWGSETPEALGQRNAAHPHKLVRLREQVADTGTPVQRRRQSSCTDCTAAPTAEDTK